MSNLVETQVQQLIDDFNVVPGALLPLLHALQNEFGYVPSIAIPLIAKKLSRSTAEVAGVISFYHHFRTKPPGDNVLQICCAEACQAVGGRQSEAYTKQRLAIDYHQTTPDGLISLEPVYCLGNCASGPSMRIGDTIIGRVSPKRLDQLLDTLMTQVVEVRD